jgi:hypothetical protein
MAHRAIRHAVALISLVAIAVAVYAVTLRAGFVYEDANWLPHVADPIAWVFPSRALTMWTLSASETGAIAPLPYHAVNLALHLATGLAVYGLAATLIPGSASVWAAGVFLLHPLNSEAVSYVSARTDLLSTLGIVLALCCAVRWTSAWRWVGCVAALLLAGLSKEIGLVGVLLVLWTLSIWRSETFRRVWPVALAGVVVLLLPILPRLWAWMALAPSAGGSLESWTSHVGLQLTALWHLLALLMPSPSWAQSFSIDHDVIGLAPIWRDAAVTLTALSAVVGLGLWLMGSRLVPWVLGIGAISLAPRILIPTNELMTEPHLYTSMAAISVALGAGLARVWRAESRQEPVYE